MSARPLEAGAPDGSSGGRLLKTERILVASHGTEGARAAEALALSLCPPGGSLFHLIVVPDFWKGMMGDDWLNNASTRIRFGTYVEDQLAADVAVEVSRFAAEAAARGFDCDHEAAFGKPAECLLDLAGRHACDLVVLGARRPPDVTGYHSRLDLDLLSRCLTTPLLVAPHPRR